MIIIIDGPEKAGKTTLVKHLHDFMALSGYVVNVRKWTGPASPDDSIYGEALQRDIARPDAITIWDRSWVSEFVYSTLLNRTSRLNGDSFLGEWLYGRSAVTHGLRIILTADPAELVARRDETDLPVDPYKEAQAFSDYAKAYGYSLMTNDYTQQGLASKLFRIMQKVINFPHRIWPATGFAGFPQSRILFSDSYRPVIYGGFAPYSSEEGLQIGKSFGPRAITDMAWVNLDQATEDMFEHAEIYVSTDPNPQTGWTELCTFDGEVGSGSVEFYDGVTTTTSIQDLIGAVMNTIEEGENV